MIPGNLAAKCLYVLLESRCRELERRGGAGSKGAGRAQAVLEYRRQLAVLREVQGERGGRWAAPVDPATLGWLCAWAAGLPGAKHGLVAHLIGLRHPRAMAVGALGREQPGEALRLITDEAADAR